MNYRDYKNFAPGQYYHIFNRGVGQMNIFKEEDDWIFFVRRLREMLPDPTMVPIVKGYNGYIRRPLPLRSLSLIAYCLMPNHFHFLLRQNQNVQVGKFISKLSTSYSKYFNQKYERVGGLFQGTFKAITIENDNYSAWLSAYIHTNPVVANLVNDPEDWPWSSYCDYIYPTRRVFCEPDSVIKQFKNIAHYRKFVESSSELIKNRKELQVYLFD